MNGIIYRLNIARNMKWLVTRAYSIAIGIALGMVPAYAEAQPQANDDTGGSVYTDTSKQPLVLKVYAAMEGAMMASECAGCTFGDLQTIVEDEHTISRATSSVHLFGLGTYTHLLIPIANTIDVGIMAGAFLPFVGSWNPIAIRIPIKAMAKVDIVRELAIVPEVGAVLIADSIENDFILSGDVALTVHILNTIDLRVGLVYGNHFGLYGGIGVALIDIPLNSLE